MIVSPPWPNLFSLWQYLPCQWISAVLIVGIGCGFLLGWLVGLRAAPCCCCLFPGFCGGEPCRADVACWGGWGPHTPCARQIGPHPPQPTPPSRHGSLRCVWERRQKCGCHFVSRCVVCPLFFFSRVTPPSGARAHGIARARGEPFRQSLLAVCGGRLTPSPFKVLPRAEVACRYSVERRLKARERLLGCGRLSSRGLSGMHRPA